MDDQSGPRVQEPKQQAWPLPQTLPEQTTAPAPLADGDHTEQQSALEKKLAHTLVLDSGPIIKNVPTITYLLANSHKIITIPEVINELRDETTRARVQTQLMPFLEVRSPKPESIKKVMDFARRTGDLDVLSRPDLRVLALAYEIEVERNGGDWRLRNMPGQKGLNGKPPGKKEEENQITEAEGDGDASIAVEQDQEPAQVPADDDSNNEVDHTADLNETVEILAKTTISVEEEAQPSTSPDRRRSSTIAYAEGVASTEEVEALQQSGERQDSTLADAPDSQPAALADAGDDDEGGWITYTNIKQHQAKDTPALVSSTPLERTMQCATLTTDFAMQNVLLQMNLNLLSPQLQRIRHLKTFILRCHACFFQCKDTSKQFCPRCGKPSLTRVSCSTNANGEFQIHLKKNMQWNNRGNKYSVPKPVTGSASGRVIQGGGKGGWGQDLILAEDQKEYVQAMSRQKRAKERDLMNEDFLPGILSGDRTRDVTRPKVGAGRNVNAKKRK